MSIAKLVFGSNLRPDAGLLNGLEDEFYPALHRILDIHFRNLAVIADTLSDPENVVTIQTLFAAFKMQHDSLIANISESLSLIDEMWLQLHSQHEQQFAMDDDAVAQGEQPAVESKSSVGH